MAVDAILKQLHDIARNPKVQFAKYLKEGKKVVGVTPYFVPEEIIHSMGFLPFGVWGGDVQLKEAQRYFAPFYCAIVQSIVELGIKGTFKGMTALVVPPLCDTLRGLGENWKYADNAKEIPFIPMTYPQNRKIPAGQDFTRAGYDRLISDLKKLGGSFDNAKLLKSIEVYNAHNHAMRAIAVASADHPTITPSRRSDIFKSAFFMPKEEHTPILNTLLDELFALADRTGKKKRVITVGILADAPGLLSVFDSHGYQIVGDDIAAESRAYRVDAIDGATGLDKMVLKFTNTEDCLLFDPKKQRAYDIVEMVKARRAAGVVVVQTKFCDPEEWDYPIIKAALDKADIPNTIIEVDRQMDNYQQAKTNLEAFGEML